MLIEIKDLKKVYSVEGAETPAVNGINLEIKEGEFVAIIGPSGSGKSTLLQILGCLDRPSGGEYFLDGKEISKYSDDELAHLRNKKFGFVFQAFNLLGRMSVLENVELPLVYAGIPEEKRKTVAKKVIDSVGLSDRIDFETMRLSGGQKQRVAIARALVNEPRIVFADEPTGNLDSKSGEVILEFFEKLHEQGHTIVLVTHETFLAESAERIIHLKDGLIEKEEIINHESFRDKKFFK